MAPVSTNALAPIDNNETSEDPEPMILSSGVANLKRRVHETETRPNASESKFQKLPPKQLLPLPVSNLPDLPPVETKRPDIVRSQKHQSHEGAEKENALASRFRMPPELEWYFKQVEAKYECPQHEARLPQLAVPIHISVAAADKAVADSGYMEVKVSELVGPRPHDKCFMILMKLLVGRTGGPAQTYLAARSTEGDQRYKFGNYLVLRTYPKDDLGLTTFQRELSVFKRLSKGAKDFIVGLDAAFSNEDSCFFAMPVMRCNLAQVLTREHKDVTDTIRHDFSKPWITQIASGLDHLHNHGVIHSNLKPSNILLDWDGCVKISDFTCAYVHLADEPLKVYPVRYSDRFCGSLPYMGPEQRALLELPSAASGSSGREGSKSKSNKLRGFGKEVDVWALGCVAAELCRDDHYRPIFESDSDFQRFAKADENTRRAYLHQYAIPTHFQVEFILLLLEPDVSKRLRIPEFKNTEYYKMNKKLTFSDYAKKRLRAEDIPDFALEFDLSKESISSNPDALFTVSIEGKYKNYLSARNEESH
ncbi:hypothetical protein MD484_g7781, partial [Candolleomyces efflorescens]